jgi:hypothetical protein
MDDRQRMMRASDADRQEVVDRLRAALDEGRLKMEEYIDRMGLASEALTYGELVPLYADLPENTSVARLDPVPAPAAQPQAPPPAAAARHGLPTALKVLWTIWGAIVAVNVVIWALVSATTAHLIYPWPVWVAGPLGAILLAVTFGVTQIRRGNPPPGKQLPPGQA